ncbi:hypothetical protein SAMN04488063_0262 [Halopelagius inordinatus]|uniref:Halobacterial output domain-containing protein n=1 Tax=Halopelagius inordinatus TaxID=553467 RepID=A0A1I2LHS8_9EURY|nr:HalOD1 output domain-containing protein [Halopelagius inordinatus]SFF78108.1 hypothetical protein SAMN04488063_0262 [Halopelagius inordinatus]
MVTSDETPPEDANCVAVHALGEESESVIGETLRILADMEDVPVDDLEPLYHRVETDAVVSLLAHARESNSAVSVEFTVDEYTVAVSHDYRESPRDESQVVVEVVDGT